MNLSKLTVALLLISLSYSSVAQSRAIKRQQDSLLRAEIDNLVRTGNFAVLVVHQPTRSLYTSHVNNFEERRIIIRNDSIFGDLPFQGSSSSSPYHSSFGGYRFYDPIETGTVKKKRRHYLVSLLVRQSAEIFNIAIEIDFHGNVSMHINSSKRSVSLFRGVIQNP